MKTFIGLFALCLSMTALAMVELPLRTFDNAELYRVEKTKLSYSLYSGGILELVTKAELRGHPELSIQTYLVPQNLVSLEEGEFIARVGEVEAVCAYIENNKVYETGECEFSVKVKNNKIFTSLSFHE
jgi:hypothetical protein